MLIKSFLGGDVYKNNVTPGVYPKWSRMHLRIWCISRIESMVLVPLTALYRSAPLRAFAIRQLGATVGTNLQCAHDSVLHGPLDLITIDDDVAIQTGAYIHTTRWSGQYLEVGPIHLGSGCKIGMRAAVANNVTVGSGTWVTPFTPILSDVGSHEVWEGSPARLTGRCTELKRTAKACEYAQPIWLLESLNVLMQTVLSFSITAVPVAVILWLVGTLYPAGHNEHVRIRSPDRSVPGACLAPDPLHLSNHVGHHRTDLGAGMHLHSVHCRLTRFVPVTRAQSGSADVQSASD